MIQRSDVVEFARMSKPILQERLWRQFLQPPKMVHDNLVRDAWFSQIAERLLNGSRLIVMGKPHRLIEVEIYRRGDDHPDPFAHAEPIQLECGRWYFHQTRGHYRGGSYKGIDLTFGDGRAFGGVLFRGIEADDGTLISGPSLLVDFLLAATRTKTVAELDAAIGPFVWNPKSPVYLQGLDLLDEAPIYRSARIGLSLKRVPATRPNIEFLLRHDRFLTEPRRIRKGKSHLALSLMVQGRRLEEIQALTGSPRASLIRYRRELEQGGGHTELHPYSGCVPSVAVLCQLHGVMRQIAARVQNGTWSGVA